MSPGVEIKKGDAIKRLREEGPLDQVLGISIDDDQEDMVFLESVEDEDDVFRKCPVVGSINGDEGLEGNSINETLTEAAYIARNIYINPSSKGLKELGSGATIDRYGISDAKWMDDPEELIWKSALLAQLKAKYNAVSHHLSDPSAVDFSKSMTDEDRKLVAQRARELAARLQDAALRDIAEHTEKSVDQYREAVIKTKGLFLKGVVTSDKAIKAGGLTEADVNELFEGGK